MALSDGTKVKDTQVFYVSRPFFREAMTTFALRSRVNWLEEGMSLLSWKYVKVAELDNVDIDGVCSHLQKWAGNSKSKYAGHRSFMIGDVIKCGDNVWMALGRGWSLVPEVIWKRVIKE